MHTISLKPFEYHLSPEKKKTRAHRHLPLSPFLEYFINDRPLSAYLDQYYGHDKNSILENNIGVLGHPQDREGEVVKLKLLTGRQFTDKDLAEIRQLFPNDMDDSTKEDLLLQAKDEVARAPEVMLYSCPCGNYDCGGITVNVSFTDTRALWTFSDNGLLQFEFEKYAYLQLFKARLQKVLHGQ